MSDGAAALIRNAKELPVMPPVAAEVMKKAEDPDTNLPSLTALISRDAALVVRVLKIANSSFYSMPRKITTVQQAIVLLGYSTLRSVVVAAAIKDVFLRFGLVSNKPRRSNASSCPSRSSCSGVNPNMLLDQSLWQVKHSIRDPYRQVCRSPFFLVIVRLAPRSPTRRASVSLSFHA